MGFDPPLGAWLRARTPAMGDDLLDRTASVARAGSTARPCAARGPRHSSGERNWDYRLWGVLMLEAWLAEHPDVCTTAAPVGTRGAPR